MRFDSRGGRHNSENRTAEGLVSAFLVHRPKTPFPNEERQATMAVKRQLLTSIVRNNEDYLGKVGLALIRQDLASVFLFPVPIRKRKVFCVVVARPYNMDEVAAKVTSFPTGDWAKK